MPSIPEANSKSTIPSPQLVEFPKRHQQFIIEDGIMPKGEVHIIAAGSGVGKTTLIIQLIDDIMDGLEVFGAKTNPISPVYLCNDRSTNDFQRTIERIKPRHSYPTYSLLTSPQFSSTRTPSESIRQAKALHPEIDFVVYDPISFNVENVNSAREVSSLLRGLTKVAQELSLTIIIVHHTAKTKSDSNYESPREKMSGCGAWGAYSNLNMILVEDDKSKPTNPIRGLHVCPRNGANTYLRYILDENGCFVEAPEEDQKEAKEKARNIFNQLPIGVELKTDRFYKALGGSDGGKLHRYLAKWLKSGHLQKIKHGHYQKLRNL